MNDRDETFSVYFQDRAGFIAEAAVYMDDLKPGWWQAIDPISLDLRSNSLCILGQNGLRYSEHGSKGATGFWPAFISLGANESLWLEEIAKRMPAPVEAPEKVLV